MDVQADQRRILERELKQARYDATVAETSINLVGTTPCLKEGRKLNKALSYSRAWLRELDFPNRHYQRAYENCHDSIGAARGALPRMDAAFWR